MKSILHICQNYNTKLFYTLFKSINDHKFNQIVFYPSFKNNELIFSDGIPVIKKKNINKIFRHFFLLRGIFNLFKLIFDKRFYKTDIIHCHTLFNDGIIGFFLNIIYGGKLIISIRHSDIDIYKKKFWLRPFIFILKKTNVKFIAVSPSIKLYFKQLNCQVIGNGIEDLFFENQNSKILVRGQKCKLLYIGRIIRRKNLDKIIDFYESHKELIDLTVIGDENPRTKWSKKILERLKKNGSIRYFKSLPKKCIKREIDSSNIFILPSVNETFGIVFIESISRGVPIIFTKGTSVDGFFMSQVGKSIDKFDTESIFLAVNEILNDYENLSFNCVNESGKHSWSEVATNVINIYIS